MSESKTDYSYQSVPSSFDDFEKEDRFYVEMCCRLDAYVQRKGRFAYWFCFLLWIVCPPIVMSLGKNGSDLGIIIGSFFVWGLAYGTLYYFVPLERIKAVLNFISEEWDPLGGDRLNLWFKLTDHPNEQALYVFKLNAALTILTLGYDSELRTDGFKGFDPVVERLRIIAEDKKGKPKQPKPWVNPDGSVLINPQF